MRRGVRGFAARREREPSFQSGALAICQTRTGSGADSAEWAPLGACDKECTVAPTHEPTSCDIMRRGWKLVPRWFTRERSRGFTFQGGWSGAFLAVPLRGVHLF